MLTQEQRDAIQKSAEYASLKENPGFKLVVAEARTALLKYWTQLLSARPDELPGIQGFIAGANFVLELADEHVAESKFALEQDIREREEAVAQSRLIAAAQRERGGSRLRLGADLG